MNRRRNISNSKENNLVVSGSAPLPSAPLVNDNAYFKNENVFCLMGHGAYNNTEPKFYKLAQNEFYANSTKCGFVAFFDREKLNQFIFTKYKIPIPVQFTSTYHTLNALPVFKNSQQAHYSKLRNNQSITSNNVSISQNAFKMYVPFSHKTRTNTITNDIFYYFNTHKLKNFTHNDTITFGGKEHILPKDHYSIYTITWSGIVPSHSNDKISDIDLSEMNKTTNWIIDTFNITDPLIIPRTSPYVFVFIVPNPIFNSPYSTLHKNKDKISPLYKHFFDLLDTMSHLSIIPIKEFCLDYDNYTIGQIFNMNRPIKDIYEMIHSYKQNDEPILLINPLCRVKFNSTENNANQLQYESNENTNVRSIRKTRKHTYNALKKRAKRILKNKGLANTLKNIYGPTYRYLIDKELVSNLTNLPKNEVNAVVNKLPYGRIFNNTNKPKVKTNNSQ